MGTDALERKVGKSLIKLGLWLGEPQWDLLSRSVSKTQGTHQKGVVVRHVTQCQFHGSRTQISPKSSSSSQCEPLQTCGGIFSLRAQGQTQFAQNLFLGYE